jgi:GNAT superfamily N-acetyltransferase
MAEADGGILGYILLLFSRVTSVARIYSITVLNDEARGRGIGLALVAAGEARAWAEERAYMSGWRSAATT